jgi:Lrp/AsnC family leucine-responsive transcriptional regulator
MKLGTDIDLDRVDLEILDLLQQDCRMSLARIGEEVDLSAPAVLERIKKLEAAHVVQGSRAVLDARRIGLDVTSFIGVSASARRIETIENKIGGLDDVLECHHVTGGYTLLVKVKTANTSTLERLIREIRSLDGVERTETLVVLSTHTERTRVPLPPPPPAPGNGRRARRHRGETTPNGEHPHG